MKSVILIFLCTGAAYLIGRSHERAFKQAENDRLKQDNGKLRQVLVRMIHPRTPSRN